MASFLLPQRYLIPNKSVKMESDALQSSSSFKTQAEGSGSARLEGDKVILHFTGHTHEYVIDFLDDTAGTLDALLTLFQQHVCDKQFQENIHAVAKTPDHYGCDIKIQSEKVQDITFYKRDVHGKKTQLSTYSKVADKVDTLVTDTLSAENVRSKAARLKEKMRGVMKEVGVAVSQLKHQVMMRIKVHKETDEEEPATQDSLRNKLKAFKDIAAQVIGRKRSAKIAPDLESLKEEQAIQRIRKETAVEMAHLAHELSDEDYEPKNIWEISELAQIKTIDLNNPVHKMLVERFCAKMQRVAQETDSSKLKNLFIDENFRDALQSVIRYYKIAHPEAMESQINMLEKLSDKRKCYLLFTGGVRCYESEKGWPCAIKPELTHLQIMRTDVLNWPFFIPQPQRKGYVRVKIANPELKKLLKNMTVNNMGLLLDMNKSESHAVDFTPDTIDAVCKEIERVTTSYEVVMEKFKQLGDERSAKYMQWELDAVKYVILEHFKKYFDSQIQQDIEDPELQKSLDALLHYCIPEAEKGQVTITLRRQPFANDLEKALRDLNQATEVNPYDALL